jgi:hypothetical protein
MSTGRIHITINPELVAAVLEQLALAEALLTFLQSLTPLEKKRLVKPRASAEAVIEGVASLQREAGLPLAEDDPMLADLSVYRGLTQIRDRLSVFAQRVEDTRFLAGSEGWRLALNRYGMLRKIERTNPTLKTRLDRLQRQIAGSGRTVPGEEEPEVPEPIE